MPCDTTAMDILTSAYPTSKENVPGVIATESTELLEVVNRAQRRIYSVASLINPTLFADVETVKYNDVNGWNRPRSAESIFRLQNHADNSQIVVVSWDDLKAEPGLPAVYPYGQVFRSAGNALDPATTVLIDFFFSKRPLKLDSLNSPLDQLWLEQFNDFLIYVVALYLAEKDGRMTEVAGYIREIERCALQFMQFCERETLDIRRRWGQVRRTTSPSIIPIMSILTGPQAVLPGAAKA